MPRGKKADTTEFHEQTPEAIKASNAKVEDAAECYLETKELKASIARMSQKLSATYARFENMGVDVEAVKDCHKLDKHEDPAGKLRRIMTMAAILDIIPTETDKNGQISVMPGLTVQGLDEATRHKIDIAKAYNDGYNTGLDGGSETNNKYAVGSEFRVKWSLGHIDGQAQRALKKPGAEKIKKLPAEPRPRGRPRKDKGATVLEADEEAYRAKAGANLHDADPPTGTIQ